MKDVPRLCPAARSLRAVALCCAFALLDACAYDWAVANEGADSEIGRPELDGAARHQERDGDVEIAHGEPGSTERDAAPAQAAPDAGTNKTDAHVAAMLEVSSLADASADAQPDDGSSPEASIEASTISEMPDAAPPDAAPGRRCASVDAAFCADFENGSLDVFSWHEVTPNTQASVSVVDAGAPGGRALRSAIAGTADESARVVVRLLDAAPTSLRASFDLLPSLSLPAAGEELVFWFRLTEQSGGNYAGVYLGSRRDGTFLVIHNNDGVNESFDLHRVADLPAGWVRVALELTLGRAGSATLRFNDAVALSYNGPIQVTNVTQSFVQLGLYASQTPPSSALYDNVLVDFVP